MTRAAVSLDPPRAPSRLLLRAETPSIAAVVFLVAVFSITAPRFLSADNLEAIVTQVAIVGVIALAANQVILSGEIDISMGSLLGLCAMAAGSVGVSHGGFVLPFLTAIGIGVAVGCINGLLVTRAGIASIVATLGMLYAVRGVLLVLAQGHEVVGFPDSSAFLGAGSVFGIGTSVWTLLVLLLVVAYLARHSTWGRDVVALGDNRRAARLAGVRVDRTRFLAFVLLGGFTGVAAMIYLGQVGAVQPVAGTGLELQVIAAVVIGGTSILGGRGSTLAPVVGAILIGVISNGLLLLGVANIWMEVVSGALILGALALDSARRRVLEGAR